MCSKQQYNFVIAIIIILLTPAANAALVKYDAKFEYGNYKQIHNAFIEFGIIFDQNNINPSGHDTDQSASTYFILNSNKHVDHELLYFNASFDNEKYTRDDIQTLEFLEAAYYDSDDIWTGTYTWFDGETNYEEWIFTLNNNNHVAYFSGYAAVVLGVGGIGLEGESPEYYSVTQSLRPVPIPATGWLLGSAVISLLGFNSRKKILNLPGKFTRTPISSKHSSNVINLFSWI